MNFTNVKLILVREIRDQLRDRRTLFMIAILPLLLYPLLGISFSQMIQFLQHRTRVLVIGSADLNDFVPLVEEDHFAKDLDKARLLEVTLQPDNTVADEGDPLERMKDHFIAVDRAARLVSGALRSCQRCVVLRAARS